MGVKSDRRYNHIACHLIPHDKQPCVSPVGIGEVPRRIIAKAVLHLVDLDIREACGALQVCAGCEGGCEAACCSNSYMLCVNYSFILSHRQLF